MKLNFNRNRILWALLATCILSFGCKPTINSEDHDILFLASKGLWVDSAGTNTANTNLAISAAFSKYDGAEVDIQMSRNGTVWLSDLIMPENCSGNKKCFTDLSDEEIRYMAKCNSDWNFQTLEEAFIMLNKENFGKVLLLEVKNWYPPVCKQVTKNESKYMQSMADEVIRLYELYKPITKIIVESDNSYFLDRVKFESPKITTLYKAANNLEESFLKAVKENYDGVSFNAADEEFSESLVENIRREGLLLQIWNVENSSKKSIDFQNNADFVKCDTYDCLNEPVE